MQIVVVTVNTAVDWVISVRSLSEDNPLAEQSDVYAAGKGVNVAKTLVAIGGKVKALGFVGEQSLAEFDSLAGHGIECKFTKIPGTTRTNLTIFAKDALQETHIRTPGYSVTLKDCDEFCKFLSSQINNACIVVFSGSLPTSAPSDLYATLIQICHAKGAIAFLDSSDEALQSGIAARPFLIKPNQFELEKLVGQPLREKQDVIVAAQSFVKQGIAWVVVSLAKDGAVFVNKEHAFLAHAPDVVAQEIITHVGCGDAMVAGLAYGVAKKESIETIIKLGVACGTANLFAKEPGSIALKKYVELKDAVKITRLY